VTSYVSIAAVLQLSSEWLNALQVCLG